MSAKKLAVKLFIYLLVALFLAFLLFPILWTILTSIKPKHELFTLKMNFAFWPQEPTIQNYISLFDESNRFLPGVYHSLVVAVATSIITIVLSCMAAYSCSRFLFKGRDTIMSGFLLIHMFPSVLLLLPIYVMFQQAHLINTHSGLVIAYCTFSIPFAVWLLTGTMNTVPVEVEESARIDGCNRLQGFMRVVLPLLAPGLVAVLVYVFIDAWNEFTYANLFLNDKKRTLPIVLYSFKNKNVIDWGLLTSGSILTSLPVVVGFMLVQKNFVSGLTAGAVKG